MRYLRHTRRGICFFDKNTGGGSGGSSGTSGGSGNGQEGGAGATSDLDPKLFDSLPWDELDDDSKTTLEKIKAGALATLQSNQQLQKKATDADSLARRFQSEADKAKKAAGQQKTNEPDPYLEIIETELRGAGYSPDEAQKLAPTFVNMFKGVGAIQRREIGADLQPMASTVLASQATDAFSIAQTQDTLGMLQIPAVRQQVWDIVRARVEQGEGNSPEIVLNLAKMAWADHEATSRAGGTPQHQQSDPANRMILPATPPQLGFNTGGGGGHFGGGQIPAWGVRQIDPNAARTQLNPDTAAALASSFNTMLRGLPKMTVPDILKGAGGAK